MLSRKLLFYSWAGSVFWELWIPVIGLVAGGFLSQWPTATLYFPSIGIGDNFAWSIPFFIKNEQIRKKILFPAGITVLIILAFFNVEAVRLLENNLELLVMPCR